MFDNDTLVRVHIRNYEDLLWESEKRGPIQNRELVPFRRQFDIAATRLVASAQQTVCRIGFLQNTAVCPVAV